MKEGQAEPVENSGYPRGVRGIRQVFVQVPPPPYRISPRKQQLNTAKSSSAAEQEKVLDKPRGSKEKPASEPPAPQATEPKKATPKKGKAKGKAKAKMKAEESDQGVDGEEERAGPKPKGRKRKGEFHPSGRNRYDG